MPVRPCRRRGGLGRLTFGATADDLEAAGVKMEAVTAGLEEATRNSGRLERRLARAVDTLGSEETDRDDLVVALATAFDANPAAFNVAGDAFGAADPQARRLVARALSTLTAHDLDGFTALLAADAQLAFYEGLGQKYEFEGRGAIESAVASTLPVNPRPDSRMVQSGDLVWVRYVEADTSGVMVTRVTDGRIARQWIVMLRPGDRTG